MTFTYEEYERIYLDLRDKFTNIEELALYYDISTLYAKYVTDIGRNLYNLEEHND
jgi:hypothetical protein